MRCWGTHTNRSRTQWELRTQQKPVIVTFSCETTVRLAYAYTSMCARAFPFRFRSRVRTKTLCTAVSVTLSCTVRLRPRSAERGPARRVCALPFLPEACIAIGARTGDRIVIRVPLRDRISGNGDPFGERPGSGTRLSGPSSSTHSSQLPPAGRGASFQICERGLPPRVSSSYSLR